MKEFLFQKFLQENEDRIYYGHMNDQEILRLAFYAGLEAQHPLVNATFDDIQGFEDSNIIIKDTKYSQKEWVVWLESMLIECPICEEKLKIQIMSDWPDCNKDPLYTFNIICSNEECIFDIEVEFSEWKKLKSIIQEEWK